MHFYLVDGEMLLCMPIVMIIDGPNLYRGSIHQIHGSTLETKSN